MTISTSMGFIHVCIYLYIHFRCYIRYSCLYCGITNLRISKALKHSAIDASCFLECLEMWSKILLHVLSILIHIKLVRSRANGTAALKASHVHVHVLYVFVYPMKPHQWLIVRTSLNYTVSTFELPCSLFRIACGFSRSTSGASDVKQLYQQVMFRTTVLIYRVWKGHFHYLRNISKKLIWHVSSESIYINTPNNTLQYWHFCQANGYNVMINLVSREHTNVRK